MALSLSHSIPQNYTGCTNTISFLGGGETRVRRSNIHYIETIRRYLLRLLFIVHPILVFS